MDLKSLQNQGNRKGSHGSAQLNGTKPRLCSNSLAQLAFNGPSKALDEYWRTCLREVSKEKRKEDQKNHPSFLEADWLELRQHIHQAYHATEAEGPPQKNSRIEKVIKRLCSKDSQQLLLFLESQVQEFVIEVKVGLLELLSKNTPGVQLSRNFLTGLVDAYTRLCAGAKRLAPPLKGVEEKHLSMFGMSWEDLNKLLFERCVHADPVMQLKVPQFIGHLHASLPAKDKSSFYGIFQRILALEDEMTIIATKWKKVETFVHEKNMSSLNLMVEELKLDSCGGQTSSKGQGRNKNQVAEREAIAKEICECRICTSPLLQQLSSMGLTSQNYKEVRERLRKMLDQKNQGTKSKVVATNAIASTSQSSKVATNKPTSQQQQQQQQQQQNSNTSGSSGGSQKNQGKQKGAQQKNKPNASTTTASVPYNAKQQANLTAAAASTNGKQASAQGNKPGSSKIPAPMPPYVKKVPTPAPSVLPASGGKQSKAPKQQQQASCTAPQNGKHPTCCCAEAKEAHARRLARVQSASSSSSSTQPSTPLVNKDDQLIGLRDIDELVHFIEGTDHVQIHQMNEKKAAKKARQKQKKLEERQMQLLMDDDDYDDDDEEEDYTPAPAAVVHVKRGSPAPKNLTPVRAASQQAAAVTQARNGSPQMVTIRRVMEHSNAEPTVTITLKGDTPEKDTVLFTLVNGQVCKDENSKQNKGKEQQSQQQSTSGNTQPSSKKSKKKKKGDAATNSKQQQQAKTVAPPKPHVTVTPISQQSSISGTILEPIPYHPNGPLIQPPRPPSSNSLLFTNHSSTGLGAFYAPATLHPSSTPAPASQYHQPSNFVLDSIKLPPGITITKVDSQQQTHMRNSNSPSSQHQREQEMRQYMPLPPTLPHGVTMANARMGGMPGPMGMGGGMGMVNPNVIVVDTGKLIEDSKIVNHQPSNGEVNRMENDQRVQNGGVIPSGNYVTLKRMDNGSSVSIIPSNCPTNSNGDQTTTSRKKKNKKKNKGKKVDEWNLVESVFAPKDIDLDAVDDDERELEAFKRFCFNSVPPERKEKVHLNLKDLVIKKKP